MPPIHQSAFYESAADNAVRCTLCPHACTIVPGRRGICGVRENRDGILYSLVYGRPCSMAVDPIEKKPLFHVLPGSRSFSIAAPGCNFKCRFCQNHSISQVRDLALLEDREIPPDEVLLAALDTEAASISYTYTEPTVFFEYAAAIGIKAREKKIRNVFVTNGFTSPEACAAALTFLDAVNVDLKAFRDATYKEIIGGRLQPVLDTIAFYVQNGVWVEVTTLVVPGMNDADGELKEIAAFLAGISPDLPWHVSRFHPTYRMTDREPTPAATIERAVAIGRDAGLRYVYAGNVPGSRSETTFCPDCGVALVERHGFASRIKGLRDGKCIACGAAVAGIWE